MNHSPCLLNCKQNEFSNTSENAAVIERLASIHQCSLHRISNAIVFFEANAKNTDDCAVRAFLHTLSGIKKSHHAIVTKIGRALGNSIGPIIAGRHVHCDEKSYASSDVTVMGIDRCYDVVFVKAADELDFYVNFMDVEKQPIVQSLLLTLLDLYKDFLFEVKAAYVESSSNHPEKEIIDRIYAEPELVPA